MSFSLGLLIVFISLIFGYLGGGGNIQVVLQPFEWLVIVGIAVGSFILATPQTTRKSVLSSLKKLPQGTPYSKDHYIQILTFLLNFFKQAPSSTLMELEAHLDHPSESPLFKKLQLLPNHTTLTTFFCDSFRIIMLGVSSPYTLENMIEKVLNAKSKSLKNAGYAVQQVGESLPGLGIVAAVLGVITAMGAVGSEAAVLGTKIASALVGTFIGVFLSYGIVTPIGIFLERLASAEIAPLECLKTAIVTHAEGHPPSLCVEFARQMIPEDFRPSILEMEQAIDDLYK